MADFVKGLFGGQQKVAHPHSGGDDGKRIGVILSRRFPDPRAWNTGGL